MDDVTTAPRIASVSTAVVQANFDYTFVRLTTDSGEYGTGECFMAPGIAAVARALGQVLIECDPRNVNFCRARLMAAASGSGGTSGAGMAYNAISGLEAALWDLCGKLLQEPVVRLLGGAYRDEVELYVDLHGSSQLQSMDTVMRYRIPFWRSSTGQTVLLDSYWETVEEDAWSIDAIVARARAAAGDGWRRMKFDLDVFSAPRDVNHRSISKADLRMIRETAVALREAVGDDIDIAFDCHWRFDVPSALEVARAVAEVRPLWLEDPVPPDPVALAAVASASPVPVATGENTYLLEGFERLIQHRSADVLTPDVQKAGGLLEVARIADYAARHFLPIAPHCIASPIGFTAAVHVSAASPNSLCLEFHGLDVPFWSDLVVGEPIISDGRARLPDGFGLGVELDLNVVARYAAPGEPLFDEFGAT